MCWSVRVCVVVEPSSWAGPWGQTRTVYPGPSLDREIDDRRVSEDGSRVASEKLYAAILEDQVISDKNPKVTAGWPKDLKVLEKGAIVTKLEKPN